MGDYISQETALAEQKMYSLYASTEMEVPVEAILKIPAADVMPVRHGRWKWYDSFSCRCSECEKYWIAPGDQYDYHYCPNCGAKMDGGQEE